MCVCVCARASCWRTEITTKFLITGQEFSRYFEIYLYIFAVFQHSYVFITLFLAEPLTMFCGMRFLGTLFAKHCFVLSELYQVFVEVESPFNLVYVEVRIVK
jgi:hypothetical protein